MNTQYIKYMLLPAALFSTVAFAQEENSEQINVAFRSVAQEDVLGGISSINYEKLSEKNFNTYSLDNMQGYVGGFNGASLWGQSDYLILIDGVPRDANNVKPEEIAQITFLKGANAVILYGSRAAKGALLITTKRGVEGDIQIKVNANGGVNMMKALPKYIGSAEYMTLYNQVRANEGSGALYSKEQIYNTYAGVNPYRYPNLDFFSDEYIKKAYNRWEVSTEIKGGGDRARYYSNIGYYRAGDYMNFGNASSNYTDRLNVRGNVDMNLADWITAYVNANVDFYGQRTARGGNFWANSSQFRPNRVSVFLDPSMVSESAFGALDVLKDAQLVNGMLLGGTTNVDETNVIADIYRAGKSKYNSRNFEFTAGVNLDLAKVTPGLSFKTMVAVDYAANYTTYFEDTYRTYQAEWANFNGKDEIVGLTPNGIDKHTGNQSVTNSSYTQTIDFNAHFDYERSFGLHNVNAMLLANGFQQSVSGTYHAVSNANLGLNVDYNYAHKYYAQLATAMVHSAKLAEGNRNGLSYSATLGWNIAKESALQDGIFNDLVLSASYSDIKQDIDIKYNDREYYLYAGTLNSNGSWWEWYGQDGREATAVDRGSNPGLDFINRKELSVSLRGAMFDNSLKFNLAYFNASTEGLLYAPTTIFPNYFQIGYPSTSFIPVVNYNNDKRYGYEVSLNYNKKFGEFELGLGGNLTWYNTEATKRDDSTYAHEYQYRQGKALDTAWGYECLGFFKDDADVASSPTQKLGDTPKAGDLKYKDQNNDGVIDALDQVDLGRYGWYGAPLTVGVNLTAKYKGFTLFVLGVGGFGGQANKVRLGQPDDNTNNKGYFAFAGEAKYSINARDCWTPETASTALYPRLTTGSGANNFVTSDFWMYKTDRFDIAKIQLSYECPSRWFENQNVVKGVSAFVNGSNLLTFAPEKDILELNVGSSPQNRTFMAGVQVTF